jgi:16S rRNA (guanine(1405)-N(7))-methyltransferase
VSDEPAIEAAVAAIKGSRKYRAIGEETIRALARQAATERLKPRALEKAVRRRLHGIAASHLGDPDYAALGAGLGAAVASGDDGAERALCERALQQHLSTRERWPYVQAFYGAVFERTGVPHTLLDLACGLGPLALPWMGLGPDARVLAYDVHEPRVAVLDAWLRARGQGGAEARDIVLRPPTERADVALLLKELHRLLRNYPAGVAAAWAGAGDWLARIPARHVVVSLPAFSAHGGRRLVERYHDMMARLVEGRGWPMHALVFEHEVVFCLQTGAG